MILGSIAGVDEIAGAFYGREELENFADGEANGFDRAGGSSSEKVLKLGEDLLDGVKSGEYLCMRMSLAPAERMS
jgi:hypothetical protein